MSLAEKAKQPPSMFIIQQKPSPRNGDIPDERRTEMAKVGDKVRTGQPAPETGGYDCLSCRAERLQNRIGNTKGDPMPPCNRHGAVWWELVHID